MDFLLSLGWYIIPFLFVLTILVFVHELGHYLAARWNGVGVDVFSIGFGPEIMGWTDKVGTRWKISLFPLGGYVKMIGDAGAASTPDHDKLKAMDTKTKSQSLFYKTVWQRIAVSAAGPVANYLFAIFIFAVFFSTIGQRYTEPVIGSVQESSAAEKVGLKSGDRIISVEGKAISRFEDLQQIVQMNPEKTLNLQVLREGQTLDVVITPTLSEIKDVFGQVHKIGLLGIKGSQVSFIKRSWVSSLWYATEETLNISWQTLKALGQVIIGARSSDGLGGPLRIAQMSGEVAQNGMIALVWFMALLSVNLGLINLFPVPMLDGGHLLFYFIEVVRGKPLSENAQEWGFRIGFMLIIGLMLFSTWNDLRLIFG